MNFMINYQNHLNMTLKLFREAKKLKINSRIAQAYIVSNMPMHWNDGYKRYMIKEIVRLYLTKH